MPKTKWEYCQIRKKSFNKHCFTLIINFKIKSRDVKSPKPKFSNEHNNCVNDDPDNVVKMIS